jgi:hypothetical protein
MDRMVRAAAAHSQVRTVEGHSEPIPLVEGDLVWASVNGFMDADKSWAVGILCEILRTEDGRAFYRVGRKPGKPWDGCPYFEHATKVSKSSAQRIIRTLRRARRRPLSDQIWEYLIQEHKSKLTRTAAAK